MEVQYCSDLHLEFRTMSAVRELSYDLRNKDSISSTLVLAGDISSISSFEGRDKLKEFLGYLNKEYDNILYTPGNHEYYNGGRNMLLETAKNGDDYKKYLMDLVSIYSNLTFLDNKSISIEGKNIAGTSLWWDVHKPESSTRSYMLNDFKYVVGGIEWITQQHNSSMDFIHSLVMEGQPIDLLVTHHGVTSKIAEEFIGHPANIYYYTDLSPLLAQLDVKHIIHGHQHSHDEYLIPAKNDEFCMVTRNPLGYPLKNGGNDPEFDYGACLTL